MEGNGRVVGYSKTVSDLNFQVRTVKLDVVDPVRSCLKFNPGHVLRMGNCHDG